MLTKSLYLLVVLLLIVLMSNAAFAAGLERAEPILNPQTVSLSSVNAACSLVKNNGSPGWFSWDAENGWGAFTFFDPEACGVPAYPFEITSFSFTMYDREDTLLWPSQVDIVVYRLPYDGDTCSGSVGDFDLPMEELCRFSITPDPATFEYPNIGTVDFPTPCCVDGPFFIGVQYMDGSTGSTASLLYDDNPTPISCENFIKLPNGNNVEWYTYWSPPVVGYPMFWVDGETVSQNCGYRCDAWHDNYPHKMHFPQLPDTLGWDIAALYPIEIADDFMCMETGYIKNIHFWVSWRNGIEAFYDITGLAFWIFTDIPADQSPTGYSIPGEMIGQQPISIDIRNGYGRITPMISESPEGWYNPGAPEEILPDDHNQYYQIDYCLEEFEWIPQDSGTVYWLVAQFEHTSPADGYLGWKTSVNHWNDNAVWRNASGGGSQWTELYDPLSPSQPLDMAFVITGDPEGSTTTGACCFGDGSCAQISLIDCQNGGGVYFGDGTICLGDSNGDGNDDLCVPPGPGACCLPNGSCDQLDSVLCVLLLGTYQGDNTTCLGDGNSNGVDDLCESGEPVGACCFYDGQCFDMTEAECLAGQGEWGGPGTACLGDNNPANNIDDFCEEGPFGACCFPVGLCAEHNETNCQNFGGSYLGDGTVCLGDDNNNGTDDACEEGCECDIGNANGDATINILDITYLIAYLYGGGPAPVPYGLCSGDANCDCVVNILDITYLIAFLYSGGPPPCTCEQWSINCQPPFYK